MFRRDPRSVDGQQRGAEGVGNREHGHQLAGGGDRHMQTRADLGQDAGDGEPFGADGEGAERQRSDRVPVVRHSPTIGPGIRRNNGPSAKERQAQPVDMVSAWKSTSSAMSSPWTKNDTSAMP